VARSLGREFAGGEAGLQPPASTVDGEAEKLAKKHKCGGREEVAAEDLRTAKSGGGTA
jgi:hypothetical protein